MQFVKLHSLTKELANLNQVCKERFETVKKTQSEADFYKEIKPFADEVKEKSEAWGIEMRSWLAVNNPKNIHEQQVNQTIENLQSVSIQSFFPTTSRTRFINYVTSIDYILKNVRSKLLDMGGRSG